MHFFFRRQVQKIRTLLKKNIKAHEEINVGSTEEFQGQEYRIIIISTVRSKPTLLQSDYEHKLGFLNNPKRYIFTVWKFHDFSITQILREINFSDCSSAKSTILTHLEALIFYIDEFLHFLRPKIDQYKNSEPLKLQKWQFFNFQNP